MSYAGRNCAEFDAFERERLGIVSCADFDCSDCKDPNCPHECHTRHEQVDFDMEDDSRQTELYGVDGWGRESAHEEPCAISTINVSAETTCPAPNRSANGA